MIKNIGNYYLTQDIDDAQGLKEFSEEEYFMAEQFGMYRTFEDEKMFNGIRIVFADIPWENTTIASTKGRIYKICLQLTCPNKNLAKKILKIIVYFINNKISRYNEHPIFSNKYIWDTAEGNIILYRMSRFNIHTVNIFFTSNLIREQMLRLKEGI